MIHTASASEAGWGEEGGRGLQHVFVVVVVISVVIKIWTVIGGRDQREGPVVVLGVQWFLLNAEVMPGDKNKEIKSKIGLVLSS